MSWAIIEKEEKKKEKKRLSCRRILKGPLKVPFKFERVLSISNYNHTCDESTGQHAILPRAERTLVDNPSGSPIKVNKLQCKRRGQQDRDPVNVICTEFYLHKSILCTGVNYQVSL